MNQVTTSSHLPRVEQLRAEIDAIANCPKANGEAAVKAVAALVASYPDHQWGDPQIAKAFQRQMAEALIGQDVDVVQAILNPKSGLVSKMKKLPSVAHVNEFIDAKMEPKRARIGWYIDEINRLEEVDGPQISAEQRELQAERAKVAMQAIRDAAKATQRHGLPPLKPIQEDCREEISAGTLVVSAEQMRRKENEAA